MTDPNKYAFRMLLLLVIVIILISFLFVPLKQAFEGNTALNSVIISTFCYTCSINWKYPGIFK